MSLMTFGRYLKAARIARGKTLREFCRENRLDAANMSRTERAVSLPPYDPEKIRWWLQLLGYARGSRVTRIALELAKRDHQRHITELFDEGRKLRKDVAKEIEKMRKIPLDFWHTRIR